MNLLARELAKKLADREAAIRRVRKLWTTCSCDRCTTNHLAILRALDVPCPTCSGPIRETVGLVCQTCGTDYGAQGDSDD